MEIERSGPIGTTEKREGPTDGGKRRVAMTDSSGTGREKTSIRNPVQERGIRTKKRIIDAGAALFSERGYHNVTADEIARAAGASVGTFYAYFADKHALFLAVLDDYVLQCDDVVVDGFDAIVSIEKTDVSAFIMKMIGMMISLHRVAAPLLNEFLKMSLADEEVKRRLDEVDIRVTSHVQRILTRIGMDKRRTAAAAFVLYQAGEGIIHTIALERHQVDEEAVLSELARLYTAYIKDIL
jgi:AcrR family transcriptional regulator